MTYVPSNYAQQGVFNTAPQPFNERIGFPRNNLIAQNQPMPQGYNPMAQPMNPMLDPEMQRMFQMWMQSMMGQQQPFQQQMPQEQGRPAPLDFGPGRPPDLLSPQSFAPRPMGVSRDYLTRLSGVT